MAGPVTDKATVQSVSLEVIAEKGFHGASMRAIAKQVGTSLSNLYNYYPSKAALLCDVLESGNEELRTSMLLSGDSDESGQDAFLADEYDGGAEYGAALPSAVDIVRAATEYSLDNPLMMRMAVTEARYLDGEYRDRVYAGQAKGIAILRSAISEYYGSSLPDNLDPHSTARSIMLLTSHLPNLLKSNNPDDRCRQVNNHLLVCYRLMGISA